MQFVQRRALPVGLSAAGYGYAVAGVGAFMVSTLAPAVAASRSTIVEHKKRRSRSRGAPLWRKLFLDVALLALSAYGTTVPLAAARARVTGWQGVELRSIRRSSWSAPRSSWARRSSTSESSRSPCARSSGSGGGSGHPRRMPRSSTCPGRWARILPHALLHRGHRAGVFAATSARTVNRNLEERIRYALGAEVTVQEDWGQASAALPAAPGSLGAAPIVVANDVREPPFERFQRIEGIDAVSRVFRKSQVSWRSGASLVDIAHGYRAARVSGAWPGSGADSSRRLPGASCAR